MKKLLLIFMVLLLAGCGYGKVAKKNRDLMLTLNTGQTKQEVLQLMGNPEKNEQYYRTDKKIDIWYYRTSSFESGGWDSDDYFTPMVFEDGKLIGWGEDFYDRKVKFDYTER